ncbi:MAG: fibrinogen-like YCDxxxxGGGW domain-containing protein [Polyangiales bacterium]
MGRTRLRYLVPILALFGCTARSGGGGFFPDDAAEGDDAAAVADSPAADPDAPAQADVAAGDDVPQGACVPSAVTCADESTLSVCSADGRSSNNVPCGPGTRCADGQCVANLCAPNSYSCGPGGRRACNAEGTAYVDAPCPSVANATARCEGQGVCAQVCNAGFGDCDGGAGNGCETYLQGSASHCGACGVRCETGTMCQDGRCQSSCAQTMCGELCVDTSRSVMHCGRCDAPCGATPNATPSCVAGRCVAECVEGFIDCDGSATTGCEVNPQSDPANCGACRRACASTQSCVDGSCVTAAPPRSCRELLAMRPGTPSGVQTIDPDGSGSAAPFEVYCDMSTAGGGWTLVAVITNSGTQSWTPRSTNWVTATPFGVATTPNTNADAKSRAYGSVAGDELLVTRGGTTATVELQSGTGCLRNQTLLQVMSTNSLYTTSCARSCTAVTQTGIFSAGATCHGPGVRFRCRDDLSTLTVGGYLISSDDNSMITSMTNTTSCTAYQSGLGGMSTTTMADVDASLTSSVTSTDLTQRLLYVR